MLWVVMVSIHTPTQGVTFLLVVVYHSNKVSIHTPTQGVTIGGLDQQIKSKVSIHTPTQGVTRIIWISIYLICFNPHTHAGCDRRTCNIGNSKAAVSIHTPTQGVTIVEWFTGVFDMFQSTHPRRV